MRDPEIMARVKEILAQISAIAPGHAVELRIPPYSAIQCVEGPKHTRGTPPNVVEMNAETFFALSNGSLSWSEATANGKVVASGERSNLSAIFSIYKYCKDAENSL
jgi:hypothetical protein